jgi:hypothetical protein
MKTKLVIKGAIYECKGVLVRPHFTGEFWVVDATQYKTKEDIKKEYSKECAKDFIKNGFHLTYEGINYYECEYSQYQTENMDLLSDLSEIEFFDEETDF